MKKSELVFDSVDLLYYKLHKTSLSHCGSYIDSPKWLKNKKNNNKSPLNYEQIKSHLEKISKIKPLINLYNWKEIIFPSHKRDWKKFESSNNSIVLNILCVHYNTKEIKSAYVSKHNSIRKHQVILLIITDNKKYN